MHLFVGALFVLAGLGCLRYVWTGETAFEREPPFLAQGILLIGIGAGLGARARGALLLARIALGAALVLIVVRAAGLFFGVRTPDTPDDSLVAHVYLFGFTLAAGSVVVLVLLLRRVRTESAFGSIDLLPAGGLAAALALGVVWLVTDDDRLRPCRNGSDEACGAVAAALLESDERASAALPTRADERAARVLAAHHCRTTDRSLCALQKYAAGTVDARAGRRDAAKAAFLWACAAEPSWCARAAQEPLEWTPAELERLADRRR